jgi:hypothetical protein
MFRSARQTKMDRGRCFFHPPRKLGTCSPLEREKKRGGQALGFLGRTGVGPRNRGRASHVSGQPASRRRTEARRWMGGEAAERRSGNGSQSKWLRSRVTAQQERRKPCAVGCSLDNKGGGGRDGFGWYGG